MNKLWLVILGLAAIIVIMILLWPNPEPINTQKWKDTIAKVNTQLADSSVRIQSLLKEVKELKVEHRAEKESFVGEIKGLKSNLAKKRVKIDTLIIENPELAEYVEAADSVIEVQTARIQSLEFQYDKLEINMEAIVLNFEEQIKLHEQKFQASQEMNTALEEQVKKEKRKGKLAKVLIPVVGVGMLLLGAQL